MASRLVIQQERLLVFRPVSKQEQESLTVSRIVSQQESIVVSRLVSQQERLLVFRDVSQQESPVVSRPLR